VKQHPAPSVSDRTGTQVGDAVLVQARHRDSDPPEKWRVIGTALENNGNLPALPALEAAGLEASTGANIRTLANLATLTPAADILTTFQRRPPPGSSDAPHLPQCALSSESGCVGMDQDVDSRRDIPA
jgi:hypothetical protein